MSYTEDFKGKRITIMGLGLLGRGVGDAQFLAECGANVIVTDKKTEEELAESVSRLKKFRNISFHLGGHRMEDFTNTDMVVKGAGVPLKSAEITAARAAGVRVYMSTALFSQYAIQAGAKIVGVTGTRGKTTISRLIFQTLSMAGKPAHLGGNIRGLSTLAMLPKISAGDIVVLELDSWQLQGFGDLKISPHIAVFTNLMSDHLNYYPDTDSYFSDKANIFRYQKPDDVLIAGSSIVERIRAMRAPLEPIVPDPIPSIWALRLPGEHNRENASIAAAALAALGLSEEDIRKGLETFEPVEGRLQFVREFKGVRIYNDNNASTPEATIAALRALKLQRPLTLIVGGTDKNVRLERLADEIRTSVDALVLFTGTGTEKLKPLLRMDYQEADSLEGALRTALHITPTGGTILFSPAFASFGSFVNYYDRNDKFMSLVEGLS